MSDLGSDEYEQQGTVEFSRADFKRGDVTDWSKLDIRDGVIHYGLYRQDGSWQEMVCPDNYANRCYVSWMQIHDRYNGAGDVKP